MTITITSNLSGLTKAFMRHLRGILLRIFWRLSSTMSNIQTNVRIQIMVLVTLATMFKETKMVKLIPIKRRNLRQKNLRKKPLEKRNRKARNQSLQNQQRNQKKNHQKNHQRNQKNLRSRLKRLKKN
ncbi:Uncharacterised protein [Streptococcus pneumoniae]|nr:Uncharacterised protein [Streptococcus pneumoniae]